MKRENSLKLLWWVGVPLVGAIIALTLFDLVHKPFEQGMMVMVIIMYFIYKKF